MTGPIPVTPNEQDVPMPASNSYRIEQGGRWCGTVDVPGDKSISHRALMLGAIAEGTTRIRGLLAGEDCLATAAALRRMGVTIEPHGGDRWTVSGVGMHGLRAADSALDLGNSGTGMRLMSGLLAAQAFDSVLVGDESLMQRPMLRIARPLNEMGASVETDCGRPPLRISGNCELVAIDYSMPVASAQVKSAILFAALYANGVTTVTEPGVSRDHTERMLQAFGVEVRVDGRRVSLFPPVRLQALDIEVPGDFSSAAFFIVGACIGATGPVCLRNVGVNSTRTGLLGILAEMGAQIRVEPKAPGGAEPVADIYVERSELKGIHVPPALVPNAIDEFPILCIAAAAAEGETLVTEAGELRVKESDRISAMARGLTALGISCEERPDGILIRGGQICGGEVDSQDDHRIAMAFAIAGCNALDPVMIRNTTNVATSFPGFVDAMLGVGARIVEV